MSEGGGLGRAFARGCLLPLIGGSLLGALIVWAWLQVNPSPPRPATPTPTPEIAATERIVVLVVDEKAGQPVGLWDWRSGPPAVACVASNDYWVNPPGRKLGEILALAQVEGDTSWLASHAGRVESDCNNPAAEPASAVIILPADGLAALVDALGGVDIGAETMDGPAVWWYVADDGLTPDEVQERQRQVWLALRAKIAGQPDPCPAVEQSCARLLVSPAEVDACGRLAAVLRQTPADVLAP